MPLEAQRRAYFESMFGHSDDPWRYKERWYEARKRALTMACLPHPRYASAFEPGCANGELSALLGERCDRLLISDGIAAAVALARERVAAQPHVQAVRAWLPDEWPDARFDLIVIGEFGYYLDAAALQRLAGKVRESLRPGGAVLACHWRRPIDDCLFDGDEVHRRIALELSLPLVSSLIEADFRLEVWCADGQSVAQRERIV